MSGRKSGHSAGRRTVRFVASRAKRRPSPRTSSLRKADPDLVAYGGVERRGRVATFETEYLVGATRSRDPMGRQKTAVRDEFGRTIRVEELNRHPCAGCPAKTSTTTYAYDALDRRTRITDAAGNVTETVWDSLGRKVSERDPDRGTHSWTWRDDGTPDTTTDAKGQVTRWFYDNNTGRPLRKEERTADGEVARTITWTWDRDPSSTQTHGYSLGRLVRVAYSTPVVSGDTESWYDRLGRVSRSRQCADNSCAELGFGFDPAGRLATLTYPDTQGALSNASERVTHGYDSAGRLKSVTGHDPTALPAITPYATNLSYTPLGQLTNLKHSNGVIDSLTYDDTRHWLDTIEVAGSNTLYSADYQHHRDGKIDVVTETQPDPLAKGEPTVLVQDYEYDDLARLTTVTASDPARSRAYSYDEIGRMTSSSTASTYSYDDPAHLHAPTSTAGGHTRAYDANGNLTELVDPQGRELTIEWTVSDMPERIVDNGKGKGTETAMGFDAADQRVVKHDDLGTTYYFGRYFEQDPQGRLVRYYWAGDRLVARRDGDGILTDFHQDRLGSTRLLTNAGGGVVERYDYDPFGKPLNAPTQDERMWHGERLDHDSGLIYMNARFYDPELGRFASADSIIPDPYRPQSLDRYSYVENDPANYTDPSGHMKMQVEQRKEAAAESSFAVMYLATLQSQCVWGQCPIAAGPAGQIHKQTPGRAKSDPSEWAQWPGTPSAPPLVSAPDPYPGSDPSEWEVPVSAPPLVAATDPPYPGSNPSEWAQWRSAPPVVSAPFTGRIPLIFDMERGILQVDPGGLGKPFQVLVTSGRGEAINKKSFSNIKDTGPLPPGPYVADMTQLTDPGVVGDFFRNLRGDWGDFRVPLIPLFATPRNGFFLHGGDLPGSAGCIDIGGGRFGNELTNRVLDVLRAHPNSRVPLLVF